jgi:hypothetical protein
MTMPFDNRTLAEAFSFPGIDPRVWCSYAIVDNFTDGSEEQAVEFDQDDGQPYINIVLKPHDIPARARIGMLNSGPGEGTWFPFVGGEEVLVAVPQGDPRAGCVILARLGNAYDTYPTDSVAGIDPALNSTSFIRSRPAFTIESGESITLRSATAGAMMQLSAQGNVTLRDGAANVMQMGPGVFGWQNQAGDALLQMDNIGQRFNVQIGQATIALAGNASATPALSLLQVPTPLSVTCGGNTPNTAIEHVVTTEALFNILAQLPIPGISAALIGIVASASTTPLDPALAVAIQTAFSKALPKPIGVPGFGQLSPGIGCAGFFTG